MNRTFKLLRATALAVTMATAGACAFAQSIELEGVKIDATAQVGPAALTLNGAGVRTRAIFRVYVAALYVPQKSADPAALLAQKGARRIAITMLRSVDADTFAEALSDGLRSNLSEAQFASFKPQIDSLSATLKAAGEAKKGDSIHIEFVPDTGTRVTVNGQARGAAIAGEDFYAALLRIWLGDKPVDSGLKRGLLGA